MINPNRTHRAKAVITKIQMYKSEFKLLKGGSVIRGFDIDAKFKVGDIVNIQAHYSICLDCYVVDTVNFPRKRKLSAKDIEFKKNLDSVTFEDIQAHRKTKLKAV